MENLCGKTAFITGGASGIGLGIAKAFADEGMNLIIADLRQRAIDEALPYFEQRGVNAIGVKLNVADRADYKRAVGEALEHFPSIHVLVNNAGIGCAHGPLWEVGAEDTDFALEVNLKGVLNGIQLLVPHMLAHGEGGHIVSTASKAALIPVAGCGLYNVTKQAVLAITETLAEDLEGTSVAASVLCPGPCSSNLGMSSAEVEAEVLGRELPPPPNFERPEGEEPVDFTKIFHTPEDMGRRVVRGIKRSDLYILTHSEFKAGFEERANAICRAFPDEAPGSELGKYFGMLLQNDVFNKQTQVPAL